MLINRINGQDRATAKTHFRRGRSPPRPSRGPIAALPLFLLLELQDLALPLPLPRRARGQHPPGARRRRWLPTCCSNGRPAGARDGSGILALDGVGGVGLRAELRVGEGPGVLEAVRRRAGAERAVGSARRVVTWKD